MTLRPADWLILAATLAVQGALILAYWTPRSSGAEAVVRGPDSSLRLDLEQDGVHRVPGQLGDSVLQIEAGRIRFVESPCQRKLCIHSGWHGRAGHSMACVPNRISVSIVGPAADRFDAMHY